MKHLVKVWSQAGASVVAAFIALAIGFQWVTWTPEQTGLVIGLYAAIMMTLRQLYSVDEPA